jgi:hypothetical protein
MPIYSHALGVTQSEETVKKALNDYLFAEFGFDLVGEARISDTWPFELRSLGTIQMPTGSVQAFEFHDEIESYFAISGFTLGFFETDGMTFDELRLQLIGSDWIARRNPIDLDTVRLGDDTVPSLRQRRTVIETLGAKVLPNAPAPRILQGLFLQSTSLYLGLIQDSTTGELVIVGSDLEPWSVRCPSGSSWRILAFGIGQMITEGKLEEV